MRLYIIRHGQRANTDPEYDGGPNQPLTRTGHQQAECVANFLASEELDTIFSSCQLRALQTAEPVHEQVESEWHVWPVFCESYRKRWPDRHADDPDAATQLAAWETGEQIECPTAEEVAEIDGNYYLLSDVPDKFHGATLSQPFPWPDTWWVPLEGHTHSMGFARLELGLHALLERHNDERIGIVCHGNMGDMIITTLMNFSRRHELRRFSFDNAAIARLDRRDTDLWRIVYTNHTCHLPKELRV